MKPVPSNGVIVVKKGEPVTLSCDVTGNPLPVVTWTREVCRDRVVTVTYGWTAETSNLFYLFHYTISLESNVSFYAVASLCLLIKFSLFCFIFLMLIQGAKKFIDGQHTMLGNAITFSKANRHHSGLYTCTAENSEGNPAKATINLEVTCKF